MSYLLFLLIHCRMNPPHLIFKTINMRKEVDYHGHVQESDDISRSIRLQSQIPRFLNYLYLSSPSLIVGILSLSHNFGNIGKKIKGTVVPFFGVAKTGCIRWHYIITVLWSLTSLSFTSLLSTQAISHSGLQHHCPLITLYFRPTFLNA